MGYTNIEVAKFLNTDRHTVAHWKEHYADYGDVSDLHRSGRPRVTDEATRTAIAGASLVNPFATPLQLRAELPVYDVSGRTVARILDEAGLHAHVAHHQRILTDDQRAARLSFAYGYEDWTVEDWSRVIFADEVIFYGYGAANHAYVRRPDGTAHDEQYWVHKNPHPPQVAAQACFSAKGPGFMCMYDGKCDAKRLSQIYREYVVETFKRDFGSGIIERWLLHDNDGRHGAPPMLKVLHDAGITVMDFPAYSPDLNPLENIWPDVKKRLLNEYTHTQPQLEAALAKVWAETSVELCEKLATSMPQRIKQCIDRNGAYIDY